MINLPKFYPPILSTKLKIRECSTVENLHPTLKSDCVYHYILMYARDYGTFTNIRFVVLVAVQEQQEPERTTGEWIH